MGDLSVHNHRGDGRGHMDEGRELMDDDQSGGHMDDGHMDDGHMDAARMDDGHMDDYQIGCDHIDDAPSDDGDAHKDAHTHKDALCSNTDLYTFQERTSS